MNFEFNQDQQLLQETVVRFLEREYDYRQAIAGEGDSGGVWDKLAELGMLGALLGENEGGLGGPVEAMIVMEASGEALLLEPLIGQVIVAGTILAAAGESGGRQVEAIVTGASRVVLATIEAGMMSPFDHDLIETRLTREGNGFRLHGLKAPIPDGATANRFLVTARNESGALCIISVPVGQPGVTIRRMRAIDGRGIAELELDAVLPADALIDVVNVEETLDTALDAGLAAACAELVGAMSAMLDQTREYTGQREQYGAKLATYQALQHRMADMFIAAELARSMAFLAAASIERPAAERRGAVSAAWHEVLRGARFVGENGVQLHGGMGMSEETDVAYYFTRLIAGASIWGSANRHLRRFDKAPRMDRTIAGVD